jgi:hypothetical protein
MPNTIESFRLFGMFLRAQKGSLMVGDASNTFKF